MSEISEAEIGELRERLAAITPGPWRTATNRPRGPWDDRDSIPMASDGLPVLWRNWKEACLNAHFIAHAPSDLEALLAEREGMKAEIERLRKELKLGAMQGCDGNCAADGGYPAICEMYRDNHVAGCTRQSKAECCGAITLHAYDCDRASAPLDPSSAPIRVDADLPWTPEILRDAVLHNAANAAARSPDREAGSGTPKTRTITRCPYHANRDVECAICTAVEVCGGFTFVDPSHPAPSEGGGE